MAFRESLGSSFGITLGEQILSNKSLNMPSVSRDSLDSNFVSRASDPVLGVFTPVTEYFFVHFISGSSVAVDS